MDSLISEDADHLAALISEGDTTAFRLLYDGYIERVAGFIFTLTKSRVATDEIAQECFIKLWTARTHLRNVKHFESYIFTIAKNAVIDYLRKLNKDTRLQEFIQHSIPQEQKANQHRLHEQDLQRIVDEALSELSPEKRRIFFMSKMAGMSHDEIAEALQLSKSTIKNHLSESLKHLRQYIHKHPESRGLLLLTICIFKV